MDHSMTQNTSDKTELIIEYLEKFRSAEIIAEEERPRLDSLISELKSSGQPKVAKRKKMLSWVFRLYGWRDFLYVLWALIFG